jgi:4-diphosphocytidyl-2-C-methyl-D-erythritol kinase
VSEPVTLRVKAPGKVNLCLFLGGVRADGRHELVTVFEPVSLADELVMSVVAGSDRDEVICPGVQGVNLAASALAGLRAWGWSAPAVRVEIRKRVPVAAGMGGGSADAAATLRLAPLVAPVPDQVLAELARGLGADVPSQLQPGLALGTGAGEIVQPLAPLAAHAVLILPQPVALSTPDVFREADRLGLPRSVEGLAACHEDLSGFLGTGAGIGVGTEAGAEAGAEVAGRLPPRLVANDLQPAAVSLCPQISGALEWALQSGAEQAIVCGSGPTVAGVFWGSDAAGRAADAAVALQARYPGAVAASPVDGVAAAPRRE